MPPPPAGSVEGFPSSTEGFFFEKMGSKGADLVPGKRLMGGSAFGMVIGDDDEGSGATDG